MKKDKFIFKVFNPLFWGISLAYVAAFVLLSVYSRKLPLSARQWILSISCIITIVTFFIYKYYLSIDKEYEELYYLDKGGFSWWYELPLHLCNINMFTSLLGAITLNPIIMGFAFFVGPLGALLAILMPEASFNGYSIFLWRMFGYFFTHYQIVFNCLLLCGMGLYFPEYSQLWKIFLMLVCLSFAIYLLNCYLRKKNIAPFANYFYTVYPDSNPLLELFRKWIPHEYLYLIPAFVCLLIYMYVFTFVMHLF